MFVKTAPLCLSGRDLLLCTERGKQAAAQGWETVCKLVWERNPSGRLGVATGRVLLPSASAFRITRALPVYRSHYFAPLSPIQ